MTGVQTCALPISGGLGEQQSWHDPQRSVKALTVQKEKPRIVTDPSDWGSALHTASVAMVSSLACPLVTALLPAPGSQMREFPETTLPLLHSHLRTHAGPLSQVPINHPATGCCFSKLPSVCLHLG